MSARILIIEDNPTNMELMVYLLAAFGHIPSAAYDGEEGLAAARAGRPDLILCDVHLPKYDGYAVVRSLRNDPVLHAIPAIAVTALAMAGDRERLLNAGFDGYISKPIDPQTFVGEVEKFLGIHLHSGHLFPTEPDAVGAAAATSAKRATILVVDDLALNRELIRCTLEPFGYTLVLASSVREGWERLQRDGVDLILCDLHMPGEDGYNFIRTVNQNPRLAKLPFLFLSATSACDADDRIARELGASRFLRRPIEPQELINEIEACLGESRWPRS